MGENRQRAKRTASRFFMRAIYYVHAFANPSLKSYTVSKVKGVCGPESGPVPVGGVVAHPTAGSEPDMRLSPHAQRSS
jgi:hypothetical protein